MNVTTQRSPDPNAFFILAKTRIDLKSLKQVFIMDIDTTLAMNLKTYERGPLTIELEFKKVVLQLPRLSKRALPPQFFPDNRIKRAARKGPRSDKQSEEEAPMRLHLSAFGKEALHIKSNLLDEPLRLNFDFILDNFQISEGHLEVLPLNTTVFKRPVQVRSLRLFFDEPNEPSLSSKVIFPLPEYKVELGLIGPVSNPKYIFRSEPPLPQNDILAVLLFGRPLKELSSDDSRAAKRTNQLFSQGILSLSVLYFLAGSPVQFVGFDPETGSASAGIGLDDKSVLEIGAEETGGRSTSVRRSLGKGWYLETGMEEKGSEAINSTKTKDYGLMIERIKSY